MAVTSGSNWIDLPAMRLVTRRLPSVDDISAFVGNKVTVRF